MEKCHNYRVRPVLYLILLFGLFGGCSCSDTTMLLTASICPDCSLEEMQSEPEFELEKPKPVVKKPKNIVVFGDSLSDQGNFFNILNQEFSYLKEVRMFSPPASHNGRAFTNGLLPVEYLANYYKIHLKPSFVNKPDDRRISTLKKTLTGQNYAVFNTAITSDYIGILHSPFNKFSLEYQISNYKKYGNKKHIEDTLFFIWTGGNDVLNLVADDLHTQEEKDKMISQLAFIVNQSVKRLHTLGGRKFIVVGLPNVGLTPKFYGTKMQKTASYFSEKLEDAIGKTLLSTYSPEELTWVPLIKFFGKTLEDYPEDIRHKACVLNIANGHFRLTPFIKRREFSVKFIDGCTQDDLDQGRRFFYDRLHATDAVYRKAGLKFIRTAHKLFNPPI